ncbi:MAG: DNA replication/repair protein RecF [Chloroflexota bacterium]|nr:DNA replication/repair protein RecF [Chloroflexota bacterium]
MRVRRLRLFDYRNFPRLDISLPAGPVVVVGSNAQGKSNLLEAVYLLSTLRSPRADSDGELIRWQASQVPPLARLVAEVDGRSGPLRLEVAVVAGGAPTGPAVPAGAARSADLRPRQGRASGIPHAHKVVRVNGVAKRLGDAVGQLNAVLFTAHDMDVISGPPSLRRRYLDITISQVDGGYLRALQRYAKVLLQRNHLLKRVQEGTAGRDELSFWNQELVREGSYIVRARALTVGSLGPLAATAHAALTEGREKLALIYQPQLGGAVDGPQAASLSQDELAAAFVQVLGRWSQREIGAGATLLGPHRDELVFQLDDASAAAFASRAQQRTIALALRLAEASYLRQRRGESPVLLLDDVLSELDGQRRARVLAAIADYEQVLVTATDLDRFSADFLAGAALFQVAGDSVQPMSEARGVETGEGHAAAPSP